MASKSQMSGIQGVYLAAAELTYRDLIVSITSRNARGADLFATDRSYQKTWSIQVKTNGVKRSWFSLGKEYKKDVSPTHIYIFVTLQGAEKPVYYSVPSRHVAKYGRVFHRPNGDWFGFSRKRAEELHDWSVFNQKG